MEWGQSRLVGCLGESKFELNAMMYEMLGWCLRMTCAMSLSSLLLDTLKLLGCIRLNEMNLLRLRRLRTESVGLTRTMLCPI